MLPISRMASNLRVDELGSSSAVVSWDSDSNGTVYTLDLQDTGGNTLASVETEETSVTFEDLTQSSTYVFKLFTQQTTGPPEYYTSIRIDHKKPTWLSIQAVEAYSSTGNILSPTAFQITSSKLHPNGPAENAMNGKISTAWADGAMLYSYTSTTTGAYWQAGLITPTQLSSLRLYTHSVYKLDSGYESTLTMTKQSGEKVIYSLTGEYAVASGDLTFQEITFSAADTSTAASAPVTTSSSPLKPQYKSVRFVHNVTKYITLVEVEVYNGAGLKLSSSNFTISSSTVLGSYAAANAMNGNTDTSTYKNGATMTPVTGNYWQAVLKTPTEISQVKVFYWNSSTYLGYLESAQLQLTDVDNRNTLYELSGVVEQTIHVA